MAQTPTTKSQVQAYRFVLKRMESALVRKDAVMLHDPMRTHIRSVIIGFLIGALGLGGFFVYGLFSKDPKLEAAGIYTSKSSGTNYIYLPDSDQGELLIPVTNLASARLILFHIGAQEAATATVQRLDDKAFEGVTRGPLAGLPDAPLDIPDPDELIEPKWSVCDTLQPDESKPGDSRLSQATITTTAIMGFGRVGRPLRDSETLYVTPMGAQDQHYLIFDGKRAKVDPERDNGAVRRAFGLGNVPPRPVSMELLNAIPEVPEVAAPEIAGLGEPSALSGRSVGEVFGIERPGLPTEWHVALSAGTQLVTRSIADLIRFTYSDEPEIDVIKPSELPTIDVLGETDPGSLGVLLRNFPPDIANPMPVDDSEVACLHWTTERVRGEISYPTTVTVARELRVPEHLEMKNPEEAPDPIRLAQANDNGLGLDEVLIPAGKGGAVRGMAPDGQPEDTGTMWLVSDRGVKYAFPDTDRHKAADIAAGIGLPPPFGPAPEAILRILPTGSDLDPAKAYVKRDRFEVSETGTELPSATAPPTTETEAADDVFGFRGNQRQGR